MEEVDRKSILLYNDNFGAYHLDSKRLKLEEQVGEEGKRFGY